MAVIRNYRNVRTLRAGPLTAELENADLRYVKVGDVEIVRRLYFAVRDRNWGTVEPVYTKFEVDDRGDSFRIDIEAEHVDAVSGVDFAWSGVIEGTSEGTIRYEMEGSPRTAFLKNRIGFCVLHPSELAGAPAWTDTPDGRVESFFPELISPHQPFIDMESITHAAGENTTAEIRFEGDLFEMEDQRNWTDASFKTYSTPLRLPYPVEVVPGQEIRQAVTIEVFGEGSSIGSDVSSDAGALVVDLARRASLPAIGFGVGGRKAIGEVELERLRALRPAFVQTELDLGDDGWREKLTRAGERAAALGAALNLSVVGRRGEDGGWDELAEAAKALPVALVFAFPPVHEHVTFPRDDLATHPETIRAAKGAFRAAGSTAGIGGGTRAFFTELNRAVDFLPVRDLDVVTFTINPQVHAFDNLSIMECISAQTDVVRSARAMIGDRPLVVGPITLRQQWNPNATSAPPEPGPDVLPASVDPRQLSLFAAAWTVGSLKRHGGRGRRGGDLFRAAGLERASRSTGAFDPARALPVRPWAAFPGLSRLSGAGGVHRGRKCMGHDTASIPGRSAGGREGRQGAGDDRESDRVRAGDRARGARVASIRRWQYSTRRRMRRLRSTRNSFRRVRSRFRSMAADCHCFCGRTQWHSWVGRSPTPRAKCKRVVDVNPTLKRWANTPLCANVRSIEGASCFGM